MKTGKLVHNVNKVNDVTTAKCKLGDLSENDIFQNSKGDQWTIVKFLSEGVLCLNEHESLSEIIPEDTDVFNNCSQLNFEDLEVNSLFWVENDLYLKHSKCSSFNVFDYSEMFMDCDQLVTPEFRDIQIVGLSSGEVSEAYSEVTYQDHDHIDSLSDEFYYDDFELNNHERLLTEQYESPGRDFIVATFLENNVNLFISKDVDSLDIDLNKDEVLKLRNFLTLALRRMNTESFDNE